MVIERDAMVCREIVVLDDVVVWMFDCQNASTCWNTDHCITFLSAQSLDLVRQRERLTTAMWIHHHQVENKDLKLNTHQPRRKFFIKRVKITIIGTAKRRVNERTKRWTYIARDSRTNGMMERRTEASSEEKRVRSHRHTDWQTVVLTDSPMVGLTQWRTNRRWTNCVSTKIKCH